MSKVGGGSAFMKLRVIIIYMDTSGTYASMIISVYIVPRVYTLVLFIVLWT